MRKKYIRKPFSRREGFTMIEVLVVASLAAVLAIVLIATLIGKKSSVDLDATAKEIVSLLREAQSRSAAQEGGVVWGVHFDNNSSTPFFALFKNSYSAGSEVGHYRLPVNLLFATSSIASGGSLDITFSKTGAPSTSTSVSITQTAGGAAATAASVTRTSSGKIFFDDFNRTNL